MTRTSQMGYEQRNKMVDSGSLPEGPTATCAAWLDLDSGLSASEQR
jgi:hypothetical protein